MKTRLLGLISSLIFTLSAYLIIIRQTRAAIPIILFLAILQAMAQSIFFLHVLSEKKPRWNLLIFVSTISVVIIIVAFSIWIMDHLNANMMM
jgi:cytochrome o ubiquinol oxidase operon protein cyoD